jgi:hypothetical protein
VTVTLDDGAGAWRDTNKTATTDIALELLFRTYVRNGWVMWPELLEAGADHGRAGGRGARFVATRYAALRVGALGALLRAEDGVLMSGGTGACDQGCGAVFKLVRIGLGGSRRAFARGIW